MGLRRWIFRGEWQKSCSCTRSLNWRETSCRFKVEDLGRRAKACRVVAEEGIVWWRM